MVARLLSQHRSTDRRCVEASDDERLKRIQKVSGKIEMLEREQ